MREASRLPAFCLFYDNYRLLVHLLTKITYMNSSLFQQIEMDYLQAYKAKENVRVSVLRLIKTAVKNRLVEIKRPGGTLTDEEMLDLILKEAKQRRDSIEQFIAAGRTDLADKENAELDIIQQYLPKPLTPEELTTIIDITIEEVGATSSKDMGKVMNAIMARYRGRIDSKLLSAQVKQRLQ